MSISAINRIGKPKMGGHETFGQMDVKQFAKLFHVHFGRFWTTGFEKK